jgi:hypothetical protein
MLDISKSDNAILAELRKIRKSHKAQSSHSPDKKPHSILSVEIQKWIEYGVLPYFDIRLFERISGETITYSEIADMIWPPATFPEMLELDLTERLKKTTSQYCKDIFRRDFLEQIH